MCALLLSGCYGGKLVRGPVNSEHAAMQADSIRADQKRMLARIARLEARLAEERDERARYQARSTATIADLEDAIRVLTARLEDARQLGSDRSGRTSRAVAPVPAPADSANVDSTRSSAGGSDDEFYRAAYLDLARGNIELAIKGFKNYLVRFPTGAHLPEVHYYLGECYYAGERYLEAVGEYRYVVDNFPGSRLGPASWLKVGRCYEKLEEMNLAVRAYRTLLENYPDTEESRQARDALQNLEGQ